MFTISFMELTKNIFIPGQSPTNMRKEFKDITEHEILNIINNLPNKSSSGCDSISNTMVKSLKMNCAILYL